MAVDVGFVRKNERVAIDFFRVEIAEPDGGVHRHHLARQLGWLDDAGPDEFASQSVEVFRCDPPIEAGNRSRSPDEMMMFCWRMMRASNRDEN
jgi:hypothetical protein